MSMKKGKWILDKLLIDKFVIIGDKSYDSIRGMAKEVGY